MELVVRDPRANLPYCATIEYDMYAYCDTLPKRAPQEGYCPLPKRGCLDVYTCIHTYVRLIFHTRVCKRHTTHSNTNSVPALACVRTYVHAFVRVSVCVCAHVSLDAMGHPEVRVGVDFAAAEDDFCHPNFSSP